MEKIRLNIHGFKLIDIKECLICKKKNAFGVKEGVTRENGFCSSHKSEEFCENCFRENTFVNSYGFTFLKIQDDLFCYKPYHYLDFGFRQVLSDSEIESAFNPELYEFNKWLND